MKKNLIVLIALAIGTAWSNRAFAQHEKPGLPPAEVRAKKATEIMTCELELTAEEIPKVYAVNLIKAKRLDSVIEKLKDSPRKIDKEGTRLDKQRDVALRRTMTADHYSLYLKIIEEDYYALKKTAHCREEDNKKKH